MNLNELTAEQIVFINTINDTLIETYEKVIREKGITRDIEIPIIGTIKSFHAIPDDELTDIKNNARYLFAKTIQEKIKPIADFIQEATPDLYQSTYNLVGFLDDTDNANDNS